VLDDKQIDLNEVSPGGIAMKTLMVIAAAIAALVVVGLSHNMGSRQDE
jgi:hypothetical protein